MKILYLFDLTAAMKKIIVLAISFLLLATQYSQACLNYYVIDSSGRRHMHDDHPISNLDLNSEYDLKRLKELEQEIKKSSGNRRFEYVSDYCAFLIKLGRSRDALPILENLLKQKPNEYTLNANIAVALELLGEPERALEYLRKSLKLQPDSHYNSEWFHERILEAAVLQKKGKTSFQSMNILKLSRRDSLKKITEISYQLRERVPLTPSPNPLLSKVLTECADFFRSSLSLEWAIDLYAIAIGYTADQPAIDNLWKQINICRTRLVELRKTGKEGSVSKYLYKSSWTKEVTKQINDWKDYKPYHYTGQILTAI
jgi:tetratricopeptide (TPR) repeat protein